MPARLKPIPLFFWRTPSGRQVVRDWLREMSPSDRAVIGTDLRTLQFGWPIGMPLVRPMSGGLWELRSSLPSRREARLLFAADDGTLVVLHGFIKKTQKTPPGELALAQKRMKEMTG
jgi:phage-related protein